MLAEAHRRFPTAEFRILSLPRRAGDPISLRMSQPAEWLPNGRTTLWFDAATGRLLGARDALAMEIGRAHVCTPDTTAQTVCRLTLDKTKNNSKYDKKQRTKNT